MAANAEVTEEQYADRCFTDARALDPKLALLRRISLFGELEDEAQRALASGAVMKTYSTGQVIVRKGSAGRSLLIVSTGRAEAVLDAPGSEPVRLCEFRPGEYFGEMSLVDGAPRSATVIAREPTEILELDSEAVLARLTTPISRKLMVELSSRVRRTHDTVAELADKVYHAAYANVHAAVRVELDTIKTLYQRTEQVSNKTLEQAEQRADAAVNDARHIADSVKERVDSAMKLITKRLAPVISVAVFVLGLLGVNSYLDLKAKYAEALSWHAAMGKFQERMHSADRSLRVISETMTDLRGAREAASLHAPVQTLAELRRAALDFERAKKELFERYIASPADNVRYELFDAEVVFEAVDTFVELAAWGRIDGEPRVSSAERVRLLGALTFVVRRLSDADDASNGVQSLMDRKLRDIFYQLAQPAAGTDKKRMLAGLEQIVEKPPSARARDNAALVLASLEQKTPALRDLFANMMADGRRPERAAAGALALAKMGHLAAWKQLKAGLADELKRPAFAALLAQEERNKLLQLAKTFGDGQQQGEALVKTLQALVTDRKPENCYEQRYANLLMQRLDGQKSTASGGKPIGGECTLTGLNEKR